MAILLTEDDVRSVLTMQDTIRVLDDVFRDQAAGDAYNMPRQSLHHRRGRLRVVVGVAPSFDAYGLKAYDGPVGNMVLLYSIEKRVVEAIVQGRVLSQMRTGAASGLATRYMAVEEAASIGIIGTGWQARTQVEAICAVRPIKRVRAYSRTAERREAFAAEMSEKLGVDVVPVTSAEEAVREADVVVTITNARDPLIEGEWLKPGAHVNAAGATTPSRREVDEETVKRSDVIVVESLEQAKYECGELIWAADRAGLQWGKVVELQDLSSGRAQGRRAADSITLFSSLGVAIEDIATAAHVVGLARERGLGQEIPL